MIAEPPEMTIAGLTTIVSSLDAETPSASVTVTVSRYVPTASVPSTNTYPPVEPVLVSKVMPGMIGSMESVFDPVPPL